MRILLAILGLREPSVRKRKENVGSGPTVPNSTDPNFFRFRIIHSLSIIEGVFGAK